MSRAERESLADVLRVFEQVRSGHVLSTGALGVLFVFGSIATAMSQVGFLQTWRTFALSLGTAAIATGITILGLIVLRAIRSRVPRMRGLVTVFAAGALFGALRLEILGALHHLVAMPSLISDQIRPLAGALQGIVWVMLASTFFANREQFTEARADVLDEQARIELTAHHQSALSTAIAEELAEAVGKRVSASVSKSRELISGALGLEDSEQSLRRLAQALRKAVDDDIRPMSRELWMEAPSEQVRLSTPAMLRLGCYVSNYPIVPALLTGFVFCAPMLLSMRSSGWALAMLLAQMAAIATVLEIADRGVRTHRPDDAGGYWSGILAAALVGLVPPGIMPTFGWTEGELHYWLGFCSFGVLIVLVGTSFAFGLAGTQASVVQRARASLTTIDVAQRVRARELAEASRILSRHLHSSLQGRLMAIALELERAADEHDPAVATEAVRRLDVLLDTPLLDALGPKHLDVERSLTDLVSEWSVITEVDLHIALDSPHALERGDLVVGIVEEALANAIRHGQATHVEIRVTQEGPDVRVRVENDGRPLELSNPGLGSRWLDSISASNWTLRPRSDGTGAQLEVRLPGITAKEMTR